RIAALLEEHYGIARPQRFFIRVVTETDPEIPSEAATPRGANEEGTRGTRPRRQNVAVRYLTPPPSATSEQQPSTLETRANTTLVPPERPSVSVQKRAAAQSPVSDENPASLERPVRR